MANITINNTPTRAQYEATGGQTVFTYSFPIKAQTDLLVYKRGANDPPDDSADLLTLTTDYTVTGANTENGGFITLTVAATAGDIVTLVGDKPIDRTAIYNTSSTLKKEDLNNDFNDNVMYDKQIETIADELTPKYARSELIGPGVREDNTILPILNDGFIWRGRGNRGDNPDDIEAVLLSSIIGAGNGSTGLQVTQAGHGLSVGDWVRHDGVNYVVAQANSAVNAEAIGVVTQVIDTNTFVMQQSGHADLTGAGWGAFTAGGVYFLDENNAGDATLTEPSTQGEVSKPVFIATSTTEGWVLPYRGQILNTGGGVGGGGGAPIDATYITQTPSGTLTNEFALNSLGAGIMETDGAGNISIATNGTDYYGPGTPTPVPVDEGGTGVATFTPYAVIAGGTTGTGALQDVGALGTAGQILTSNGAGALPSWQNNAAAGAGGTVVTSTVIATHAMIDFDNVFNGTYDYYELFFDCCTVDTDDVEIRIRIGTGAGPTYQATNYRWAMEYNIADINGSSNENGAGKNTYYRLAGLAVGTDGVGNAAGEFFAGSMRIYCPSSSTLKKAFESKVSYIPANATHYSIRVNNAGVWDSTTAITSIRVYPESGNLLAGTISVIGYNV